MAERTPSRRAARARSANSLGFPPAKPGLLGACSCYSDTLLDDTAQFLQRWSLRKRSQPGGRARRGSMLYYALVFLVVALIAGVLGVSGVAAMATQIAYVLFVIAIILFL